MKTSIQIFQEGKGFPGTGFRRGLNIINVFYDFCAAGGGMIKFYSSYCHLYNSKNIGILYFYDWINSHARRQSKPNFYAYAGITGGFAAGIVSNPVEIIFSRMQAY